MGEAGVAEPDGLSYPRILAGGKSMKELRSVASRVDSLLCMAMFSLAVLIMVAQVVARYFLSSPLIWPEEVVTLLIVWMTFLGSIVVARKGEHIAVDLIFASLSARWQNRLHLIFDLAIAIILGLLAWGSLDAVQASWDLPSPMMDIPRGVNYLAIALGSAGVALYHLHHGVSMLFARHK